MSISIFLDDIRPTPVGFVRTFNVPDTIELIKKNKVDVLSLDNDLGLGLEEGYKVLDWMEEEVFGNDNASIIPEKIVVHSSNSAARKRMSVVIEKLMRVKNG